MWLSIAYTFYACMMLHGCQHACAHITLGSLYDPILVPVLARHYCYSSPHTRHLANISHTLWEKKLRLSEGTCPEGAWLTHSWVQGIHYVSVKRMVQQCLSYWGGKCIPIPHCEGGSTVSQVQVSGRRIPASSHLWALLYASRSQAASTPKWRGNSWPWLQRPEPSPHPQGFLGAWETPTGCCRSAANPKSARKQTPMWKRKDFLKMWFCS